MKLADCRLTVIGLGLMGGSLSMALKGQVASIYGVDQHAEVADRAQELGVVDEAGTDPAIGLAACDLALLAVPVRVGLELIGRLGNDLPAPPRLMDLASTKVDILLAMRELPAAVDCIGGHPLCGKERARLEAADPTLYQGAAFALVRLETTSSEMQALAVDLVVAAGGRPFEIGEDEHDRVTALTSHVPYLLAAGLVAGVGGADGERRLTRNLLASGFHDTSRLAASNVTMMLDVLTTNRQNISEQLDRVIVEVQKLQGLLASEEDDRLRQELRSIRSTKMEFAPERTERQAGHGA